MRASKFLRDGRRTSSKDNHLALIAVTGASGFLARHLIPLMLSEGHQVRAISRRGRLSPRSDLTIRTLEFPCPTDELTEAFRDCRAVVHLAATGVSPNVACRRDLEEVNVTATRSVLESAARAGASKLVIAGTWAEYGRTLDQESPVPPSAPLHPVSDYAVSKARAFGTACRLAGRLDLDISWVRIFNAFGEHQNPNALWPSLRAAAQTGTDLQLSAGEQVRDFISAERVVEQIAREISHEQQLGAIQVTNCGTGQGQSVRAFAEHWWRKWDAAGELRFGGRPARSWDPLHAVAQIGSRWIPDEKQCGDALAEYGID